MSRQYNSGLVRRALRLGIDINGRSGGLVLLVWFVNLILAAVFLWSVHQSLFESYGHSLVADRMAVGFDYRWHHEFQHRLGDAPAATIEPSIIGVGAPLANLERLLTADFLSLPPGLVGFMVLYLIVSAFLAGGVVARFHQPAGRLKISRVFAAGIRYLPRFGFLTAVLVGAYYLIFRYPVKYLGQLNDRLLLEVAYEPAFLVLDWWKLLLTVIMLGAVFMIIDYARIAMVVEERINPLRAILDAINLIARRPGATTGLYLILNLMGVVFITVYGLSALLVKGWTPAGLAAIFGLGQLLIIARVWLRLTAYASQTALYKLPTQAPPPPSPEPETAKAKSGPKSPKGPTVDKGKKDSSNEQAGKTDG